MSSSSEARGWARPGATGTTAARWGRALATALASPIALGCGGASLDIVDTVATTERASTGEALPALETGEASSEGDTSTGEPSGSDDPRLCAAECSLQLSLDWAYDGATSIAPAPPGAHAVAAMLHEPDGTLTLGEQRAGTATLHRLDRHGVLQWNVPLPLPCDTCELTDLARHPSGDLLLSASGWLVDGGFVLLAARYDPVAHALVWVSHRPLELLPGVQVRSGAIAVVSDELVAQLYLSGRYDFDVQQYTRLVVYGPGGLVVADEYLAEGASTSLRPPLLARPGPEHELVVGVFLGYDDDLFGRVVRVAPPLWHPSHSVSFPIVLDDLQVDDRGHTLELGHTFDGAYTRLVLSDRAKMDPVPRWVATVALASTTPSRAALALGRDGDAYAAVGITQAPAEDGAPLEGVSLSRFTADGELRGSTTLLQVVAQSDRPVALAIDDDDGVVIATVVDDRLRVEHRTQHCGCG